MDTTIKDKIFSTLSYLSFGILGFVLLLLKQGESRFLRYHIYQSILLGLLFMFIPYGLNILFGFIQMALKLIPGAGIYGATAFYWINQVLFFIGFGILAYSIFGVWKNQYTWIKWISAQIYKML
ncbi:MAG: hypothetical protein SFU25_05490 [Candidatus Caenarcaniphilales bacterium]|nr:hypothetical protein [Candidatus Caenarcaniphilales bacterium]